MLLTAILNRIYPPGSNLPNERNLYEEIDETRLTLRETMQRLAKEGWILIQHGKASVVSEFRGKGRFVYLTYYQELSRVIRQGVKMKKKSLKIHCSRVSLFGRQQNKKKETYHAALERMGEYRYPNKSAAEGSLLVAGVAWGRTNPTGLPARRILAADA